jgi:hypothetical protein
MSSPTRHLRAAFVVATLMASTPAGAQETFARLQLPAGVAVDLAGNVLVHSDATFTTVLTKFAPDGRPLGQAQLGGINVSEFVGSRLATDPGSGYILLLTPAGVILQVPPDGAPSTFLDLRPLQGQVFDGVWDSTTARYRSFPLAQPSYGDIAIGRPGEQVMDLFVTGTSVGFPFVMRVRLDFQRGAVDPQVIITSSGTTAGNVNLPSGIAVNQDGWAMVTMPQRTPIGFASGLVLFHATFPDARQDPNLVPRFIVDGFASLGMTTDSAGNFYVASGSVGVAACGVHGSGALVVIPRAIDRMSCRTFGSVVLNTTDVAVSGIDQSIYITINGLSGAVVRLPPSAAVAAASALPNARR